MDDILIESLIFGLVCGALLFLMTVAIDSNLLRLWTHCLTAVALIPPSHYLYGPPAVSSLISTVVLVNATVWALDTLEARKLAAADKAEALATAKVFRFEDAAESSVAARPVNTIAELEVCFS